MSIESLNAFSMDFFSLKGKTAIVTGGNSGFRPGICHGVGQSWRKYLYS
ncbi:putative short chain dehydrogenase [Escherichia coli]|uniref:Putative short chain dehydrogenase n=1 Tax=Escherichia coli TaxID=562 RepID=A0A2X3JCH2_ECOLX|nr:putative short chain dehydrogenase [Escherichia coli]